MSSPNGKSDLAAKVMEQLITDPALKQKWYAAMADHGSAMIVTDRNGVYDVLTPDQYLKGKKPGPVYMDEASDLPENTADILGELPETDCLMHGIWLNR